MGKVIIQKETTQNPLQVMGKMAGICWNAPTDDEDKNIKRALDCIETGHDFRRTCHWKFFFFSYFSQ